MYQNSSPQNNVRRQGIRRKYSDDIDIMNNHIINSIHIDNNVDIHGYVHTAVITTSNATTTKKQRLLHSNTATDITNMLDSVHINTNHINRNNNNQSMGLYSKLTNMYSRSIIDALRSVNIDVYSPDISHINILCLLCKLYDWSISSTDISNQLQSNRYSVRHISDWISKLTPASIQLQLQQHNITNYHELQMYYTSCTSEYTSTLNNQNKLLYLFVFILARQNRTTLDIELSYAIIHLILSSHSTAVVTLFIDYLQLQSIEQPGLRITYDQYSGIYEFINTTQYDAHTKQLYNYDPIDSFPVFIDDFVAWLIHNNHALINKINHHSVFDSTRQSVSTHNQLRIDTHLNNTIDSNINNKLIAIHRNLNLPSTIQPLDIDTDTTNTNHRTVNYLHHNSYISQSDNDSDDGYIGITRNRSDDHDSMQINV